MTTEKYKLYGGKVILEFDKVKHLYQVKIGEEDKKIVYGVTGILGIIGKPALVNWATRLACDKVRELSEYIPDKLEEVLVEARREHYEVSKRARELGTRVHAVADRWFSEDILGIVQEMLLVKTEEERNALSAFIKLIKEHKLERKFGERKIFSKKNFYAGTVDFIGNLDGVLTVADYKTSSAIYPEYFLQASAYAQAIEEELGLKVMQTAVIRLGKDGILEIQTDKEWREKVPVFLALKSVYEWQQGLKAKEFTKDIKVGEVTKVKEIIKKTK